MNKKIFLLASIFVLMPFVLGCSKKDINVQAPEKNTNESKKNSESNIDISYFKLDDNLLGNFGNFDVFKFKLSDVAKDKIDNGYGYYRVDVDIQYNTYVVNGTTKDKTWVDQVINSAKQIDSSFNSNDTKLAWNMVSDHRFITIANRESPDLASKGIKLIAEKFNDDNTIKLAEQLDKNFISKDVKVARDIIINSFNNFPHRPFITSFAEDLDDYTSDLFRGTIFHYLEYNNMFSDLSNFMYRPDYVPAKEYGDFYVFRATGSYGKKCLTVGSPMGLGFFDGLITKDGVMYIIGAGCFSGDQVSGPAFYVKDSLVGAVWKTDFYASFSR